MTNIGAIKVLNKDYSKCEAIVCVADGQSSILERQYKTDIAMKLSRVGKHRNFILMGTGSGNYINQIAFELQQEELYFLEDIPNQIFSLTSNIKFKKNDGLNFIIAGMDRNQQLNAANIICNGSITFPIDTIYFDGSGKRHVDDYLKSANDFGKSLFPKDLATAVTLAYEFSKKGANDLFVNDKAQYGIIFNKGISTLYHPEIELGPERSRYEQDLLGINHPNGKNISFEERKKMEEINYSVDQSLLMLYTAFQSDLCDHAYYKFMLTQSADLWADGRIKLSELELIKDKRQKSKEIVGLAVDALIKKGPEALLGYVNDFMERQKEIQKHLLP